LVQIQGVGEKTVTKLLQNFGSLERVRGASEEELAVVVGKSSARKVRLGLENSALEDQTLVAE